MPESVRDRPTKAHEYIFLLSKSPKYYYDHESIKEPAVNGDPNQPRGSKGVINNPLNGGRRKQDDVGKRTYTGFNERYTPVEKRNKRTVWTVSTKPFKGAHFATFPPDLIEPCVLAGCPEGGVVLDPFFGAGTTGLVALQNGRQYIGIELNQEYIDIARQRLNGVQRKII
jgi:DNA modification methylase